MHVINKSARLITVNGGAKPARIVPGKNQPVELSKEQAETPFVKSLIERGDLVETVAPKASKQEKLEAEKEVSDKAALQVKLDELGVEYDKRHSAKKLQEMIDEAEAK